MLMQGQSTLIVIILMESQVLIVWGVVVVVVSVTIKEIKHLYKGSHPSDL